jgi:hypothetical protein
MHVVLIVIAVLLGVAMVQAVVDLCSGRAIEPATTQSAGDGSCLALARKNQLRLKSLEDKMASATDLSNRVNMLEVSVDANERQLATMTNAQVQETNDATAMSAAS